MLLVLLLSLVCSTAGQYASNMQVGQGVYQGSQAVLQQLDSTMIAPGNGPVMTQGQGYQTGYGNQQKTILLTGNRRVISSKILKGQQNVQPGMQIQSVQYNGPLTGRKVTVYRKIVRPVKIKYTYYVHSAGEGNVVDQWVDPKDLSALQQETIASAPAPPPSSAFSAPSGGYAQQTQNFAAPAIAPTSSGYSAGTGASGSYGSSSSVQGVSGTNSGTQGGYKKKVMRQ